MENKQPKFFFFPYDGKEMTVYSQKRHEYFNSDDISNIVWINENETIQGQLLTLREILDIFPVQDGLKRHRPIIAQTETTHYPIKDRDGYSAWNCVIRIDLDLDPEHSEKIRALNFTPETYAKIYDGFILCCRNCFVHNFLYMEHSSSGTGMHIFFYYDIEARTEENFMACAEYTKHHLFESINTYIPKMTDLLEDENVFDSVYKKLFQKTYLTGKDYVLNEECSGYINENVLEDFKKQAEEIIQQKIELQNNYRANSIDIIYSPNEPITKELHHGDRFKLATALKGATKSKEEWEQEHYKLCSRYKPYRNYTLATFVNAFNYESLDETTVSVSILENYGYKIDKTKWERELGPNQYLGDVLPEILDNLEPGVNLLIAPTGCGKTVSWIKYHESIYNKLNLDMDMMFNMNPEHEKPILIIEPLNSIIETKYSDKIKLITGKKKLTDTITSYDLYVTNYNHLLTKKGDSYVPINNFDKIINQFRFIVIDESHIIIKDSYRANVLMPFIKAINSISSIPVVIQTATPMEETKIFNIKKTFNVIKKSDKEIKYIFRSCPEKTFHIQQLQCIINYYKDACSRNVYVYWNNATLQNLKGLSALFNDVVIYHKRNKDDEDMQYISSEHALNDKFKIIASSVYFGVGNDLNDSRDAAVIIVGNNTWQEDIQAIGRWRNAKNIEVCQIILPKEEMYINEDFNSEYPDYDIIFNNKEKQLTNILIDKKNRDKSITINKTEYMLNSYEDVYNYAIMKASEEYQSNIQVKIKKFEEYGIRVKNNIDKPLEINDDWLNETKKYNEQIRGIRNKTIKNIMLGKADFNEINRDTKSLTFYKIWKRMERTGLDKIIETDYLIKSSNWHKFQMYFDFLYRFEKKDMDYSELFSLLLTREKINELTKEEQIAVIGQIGDTPITRQDYIIACGYAIFCKFHNKFNNDSVVWYNYFKKYKYYAINWLSFPEYMIDFMFSKNTKQEYEEIKTQYGDFFILGDLIKNGCSIDVTCNEDIKKIIVAGKLRDFQHYLEMCWKSLKAGRPEGGEHKPYKPYKKGIDRKQKETKKIWIDDVEYPSIEDACKKLGKTRMTLNRWIKSGKAHY